MEPERLFLSLLRLFVRNAESLQRDALVRCEVAAQVDDAHAALAELAHDLVAPDEERSDLTLLGACSWRSGARIGHDDRGTLALRAGFLRLLQTLADRFAQLAEVVA